MIKSINNKIIDIKNNNEDINIFIEQYRPFIISATSKILKRYIDYYNDEEYSIALMAFSEAIQSYKVDRGDFLSFAQRLIKLRLIDNYRKHNRQKEAKLSGLEELEDEIKAQYIDKASLENYKQEGIDYLRKLEIEQFSKELVEYDISFDDLIKVSPKWKSTKVVYNALIKEAIKNPLVMKSFTKNKILNIKELEKVTNIPRKKIERARRYIVAVLIILIGDYEYLRDYISLEE
ncbi:RNA polymerase sigma-I factor [Clostridium intestinale]|uniref:RNA polymerase sigma factor SigI n=1 Tax=Clostridium intestinale URNW TaxID=1294142 RepID=U2NHA2_9CLOT|nr:RNA polymerase sigma-I factor [Clostridium intestinale]ERK28493.1 RNA polymerase sigma factor SigI [Clostridium intestinale URNW]ERK28568.1 RNA polymerase sigma factor SigI [Clostridium intestinale URNW]